MIRDLPHGQTQSDQKLDIDYKFDAFFDFDSDDRSFVTSTSAKLFALHVAKIAVATNTEIIKIKKDVLRDIIKDIPANAPASIHLWLESLANELENEELKMLLDWATNLKKEKP